MGKSYTTFDDSASAKILKRFSNVLARQTALLPVRSALLAVTSLVYLGSAFSTSAQVAGNQFWTGNPVWNNTDTTWQDYFQQLGVWVGGIANFSDIPGVPNKSITLTENISVAQLLFWNGGFELYGPHTINFPNLYSTIGVDSGTVAVAAVISSNGTIEKEGAGTLILDGRNNIRTLKINDGMVDLTNSDAFSSSRDYIFDGGSVRIGNGSFTGGINVDASFISGPTNIDLANKVYFNVAASNVNGKLVKSGEGTLTFLSPRPVSGQFEGVDIDDGVLRSSTEYFDPTYYINVSGNLIIDNESDQQYSGSIIGNFNTRTNLLGIVEKVDSNKFEFTGTSTTDWLVDSGVLVLSPHKNSGIITNNSVLHINATDLLNYDSTRIVGIGTTAFSANGQLVLNGRYNHTGDTYLSSGKISLGSAFSLPNSPNTIVSGGAEFVVGGSRVQNLTLESGSILTNDGQSGTFVVDGNFDAKTGSTLNFELGSPISTPRMSVSGNLTINDATLNVYQSGSPLAGQFGIGHYRLVDHAGVRSGNFGIVNLQHVVGTYSVLQYGSDAIDLFVVANGDSSLQYWTGGNGNWDGFKWQNLNGLGVDQWGSKIAVFKDTPLTIGGIINVSGNHSFSGLQFVDDSYIIDGYGSLSLEPGGSEIRVLADSATINTSITGSGALSKTEAGTLILNGNNSYTGGTSIYAGDIQVSSDANLGLGAVSLTGGALTIAGDFTTYRNFDVDQRGTINVMGGQSLNGNGVLSGNGNFIKDGEGTLALNGSNTLTGNIGIKAGELVVNRDAALGDVSNDVTFMGGTLTTNESFASSRNFNLDVDGKFNVGGATQLTLDGNVVGSNDIIKSGAGILALNGVNKFRNLNIADGFVVGNSASFGGDIRNAGTAIFNIAGTETYNGVIQGLNFIDGSMVKDGAGSLTLGGVSLLDWTINNGELVIDANKFGGDINVGSLGTAVVNQSTNGTLAGILSGTGNVLKNGEGTLFLTGDSSAFDGVVRITNGGINIGTADAKGSLGGSLIVESGGVLSGVGTIGSGLNSHISVTDGGILAPGNSIGTLTVNGNLVLESGSIYNVETDPLSTDSDRVIVTGDATINGGTVAHIGFAGDYALNTKYTILKADGKLAGSFGNVTSEFAFLNPTLLYDYNAGSVQLELARNEVPFISKGTTSNHLAVANALDGIGTSSDVYNAFVKLPDDKTIIGNALDSLSGEIYGSTSSALIEESQYIRDIVNNRMRGALGGIVMNDEISSTKVNQEWSAWAQAYGGWNKIDGNGNYADVKHSTGGFLVGADTIVEHGWLVGVFAGYSNSTIKADARASSASVDSFHIGAYAAKEWDNNIALRLGVANSWHKIDTERTAAFLGFGPQSLTSDANARTFQAFGEVAYKIETKKVTFEPYGNFAYINHHMGGYNEEGGSASLHGSKSKTSAVFGTVGIRAKTEVKFGANTTATVSAGAGYRKASNSVRGAASQSFTGSDEFTIYGAPIAKDAAILEAGLDIPISKKSNFNLNYQAQISTKSTAHTAGARFVIKF